MNEIGIPPHFILEQKKEVVFHVPGAYPIFLALNKWMEYFPKGWKGSVIRCEETFYTMREGTH
tara:strand:- start:195 stop:383 length:189 start_codon:yes stop_codon:yes gene_type:complete